MSKTGVVFNDKHSFYDLGLTIEKLTIGYPTKNKAVETVPFKNGEYDFSALLNGGEYTYSNRKISVIFNLYTSRKSTISSRREDLYQKASMIISHFMESGKEILRLDEIKGYYFIADVNSATDLEEVIGQGKLTIEFDCYPFMIKDSVKSITAVNSGTKEYTLINDGRPVTPIISVNIATATIEINGETIKLQEGKHPLWLKRIPTGTSVVKVTGNCNLTIEFREEKI